ncbi:PREDICTED: uncharacterized protein LOC109216362 [Nicotiana attenuata]|uniref:uncharacterized protein LOC109216362 n=1 Tax=Nicotiana attenuata TaxID=49451 RepID=UPI000904910E|nr:PREDICTED: uncharacterized protein LOC109216362 [Nicotiana attenuata]
MDPRGKKFQQQLVYEWKPMYCDKCQNIGQTCANQQVPKPQHVEQPRRRREARKVTYEWRTKGPVVEAEAANKVQAHAPNMQHHSQSSDQMIAPKNCPISETNITVRQESVQKGKDKEVASPEMNLTNFSVLPTSTSRTEVLLTKRGHSASLSLGVNKWYKQKELKNYLKINNIRLAEAQLIHCSVKGIADEIDCLVTVVYGYNTVEKIKYIWEQLEEIAQGIAKPWLTGGDFNSVLYSQDKLYENPINATETRDYANCVQIQGLNALTWEDEYYTWSNNQLGADRIWSRIDRMFGNYDRMMKWGTFVLRIGPETQQQEDTKYLVKIEGTQTYAKEDE